MDEGQFHCLKCGRDHDRTTELGALHHGGLDVQQEGFSVKTVAVGLAMLEAISVRNQSVVTIGEIEAEFDSLGFGEQLPDVSVEEIITNLVTRELIDVDTEGNELKVRYSETTTTPPDEDQSPKLFYHWMRQYYLQIQKLNER